MSGKLALPPGAAPAPKQPDWAPREADYAADGATCPFSSSPWGSALQVGPGAIGHMAGMTWSRCHARCRHFVPDEFHKRFDTVEEREKNQPSASGYCAIGAK